MSYWTLCTTTTEAAVALIYPVAIPPISTSSACLLAKQICDHKFCFTHILSSFLSFVIRCKIVCVRSADIDRQQLEVISGNTQREFSRVFPVSFVFVTNLCQPGFHHFAPSLVEFVVGLSMSSVSSPISVLCLVISVASCKGTSYIINYTCFFHLF